MIKLAAINLHFEKYQIFLFKKKEKVKKEESS